MNLKAKEVPYSSVVGSSVSLVNDAGAVVALIMVSVPNPQFDYKSTTSPIIEKITAAFGPSASTESAEARLREENRLDACRGKLSALREAERQKMNTAADRAEVAASTGDMTEVSISSTESERHRQAFSALNAAISEFDKLYFALSPACGDEAKKAEGGAKFIEGYFTDQYAAGAKPPVGPSSPTTDRREIVARIADAIKSGDLAMIYCHPEGLGAIDMPEDQRGLVEQILRAAALDGGAGE